MKISRSLYSTLLVAITEAIQGGTINEYGSFSFSDDWQQLTLKALDEEFAKCLGKALDGSSLESFVSDQLRFFRTESGVSAPKEQGPITRLKCFSDPLKVARQIMSELERVPYQYKLIVRVSLELGSLIDSDDIEINLSDRLMLISGHKIRENFKTAHENDAVNKLIRRSYYSSEAHEIDSKHLYLQYRTSGYLSVRRQSRAISEFYDEVRAFYGACIAHNIINQYSGWGDDVTPILIGNCIVDGRQEFAYIERAEDDVVRCINLSTTDVTDKAIEAGLSLSDILKPILAVFDSDNTAKLKTACSWALRAHLSNRGLDKILESAITIEVLMGDRDTSDRIGLSKLIANRCAYALGESNRERSDMVEFFVKFYRVRSEVVHSGRTALEPDERKIVNEGLTLASRILKHEILLAR